MRKLLFLCLLLAAGCHQKRSGVPPLSAFDPDAYLGQWYEIARFDHRFERGLDSVTATYTKHNGVIQAENRGYHRQKGRWKSAQAKVQRTNHNNILKVSFFPLIWSDYEILFVDPDYQYAMVGSGKNYLWFLSRDRTMPEAVYTQLVNQAQTMGYDTTRLIRVKQ